MRESHFSRSYDEARYRFIAAAGAADATLHAYALDATSSASLSIDVAIIGAAHDPAVVVSSGVHGVEGFFGSAVQLALLERLREDGHRGNMRYVLIHAVNPYGFAHLRRVNEDNVDLNRNFMVNIEDFAGAPQGYARLNNLLNPQSPPSPWEPFRAKALWKIWRHGMPVLKEAIASGQYEYPLGLFYGGNEPSASARIMQNHCDAWFSASPRIVHIDLHSGLSRYGRYKLLFTAPLGQSNPDWYAQTFGAAHVEPLTQPAGTAYRVSGQMGAWLQQHFRTRDYRFVGAEFGTYSEVQMLAALRAENRAHHYCTTDSPVYHRAKKELLECFCPASLSWRHQAIESALRIIYQGSHALLEPVQ